MRFPLSRIVHWRQANFLFTSLKYNHYMLKPHGFVVSIPHWRIGVKLIRKIIIIKCDVNKN